VESEGEAWVIERRGGEAWVRERRAREGRQERREARGERPPREERLAHQQACGFVALLALLLEGRDHAGLEHVAHAVRVHQLLRYTTHDTGYTIHTGG